MRMVWRVIALLVFLTSSMGSSFANDRPYEVTEEREPCAQYETTRMPMFGDLHVHTAYSFDSYISSQRNTPWDAYRYAKGETITLPDVEGKQRLKAQIQRPLDFTAVTDHAEFLGPINICTADPGKLGYWFPYCMMTRSNWYYVQLLAADYWVNLGVLGTSNEKERSMACSLSDCEEGETEFWNNIIAAAEEHYDRSEDCQFTTFVGYEYTDAPDANNLHRNVIFRNSKVIPSPISTYDTGSYNFPALWRALDEQCIEGTPGCDVISIPHNPNLAGGMMFPNPANTQEAEDRLRFEPVVELIQHKGASECRFDRLAGIGVQTEDELCDFEQIQSDNLTMLGSVHGEVRTDRAQPVSIEEFHPRNMMRNVLKEGVKLQQETGINPFKSGFIASTDTHSAAPGGAEENNYVGHLGRRDVGYRNIQDHFFSNPGGHAVVWAEENSRDAIFAGMKRRETYATSGTRPVVRFFGGWDMPENLCQSADMVEQGYANGVPMGGDLTRPSNANQAPKFLVSALKDPGTPEYPGTDLQRIQIIKGWVDADGQTHETVFDVAGNPDNGADVDPQSCAPRGPGYNSLCTVWTDPDFDPDQGSFYYVRVLENPSCRWSTLQCKAAGVDPFSAQCSQQAETATERVKEEKGGFGDFYGICCLDPETRPFYTPTIQERAWTSPIWYSSKAKDSTTTSATASVN